MVTVSTILGILSWCLNFIALFIFLIIIVMSIMYRRDLRNIPLMLTCNTCLASLLACIASCILASSDLSTGFLTYNLNFCYAWGLFYDIFQCSIYHSYYLQAFYRLCRVVFYKKKSLLSGYLFKMLIIGQWLFTICILLPPFFLNWYVHLPTDEYCLVPYTYVGAESYHITIIFLIPLLCISTVYLWITIFIRHSSHASSIQLAKNQRQRNLRDLTVIKRIITLISILVALRFPTVIFMIYAAIAGHLYPLTYSIVGLITSICMIFIGLMLIHITTELRNNFFIRLIYRNNQIHTEKTLQQRLTIPTTSVGGHNVPIQQNKLTSLQRQIIPEQNLPPINKEPSNE